MLNKRRPVNSHAQLLTCDRIHENISKCVAYPVLASRIFTLI